MERSEESISREDLMVETKKPLDRATVLLSQNDERWAGDVMWDRKQVMDVLVRYDGWTKQDAKGVLYPYKSGNTIGTVGCQLTCLAMVLRLLDRNRRAAYWTPRTLLREARNYLYLSPCGVSLVQIFADLCCDITDGGVQLLAKEEFMAGVAGHARVFASNIQLLRSYRSLPEAARQQFAVMIKMGTYDDSFASHYMLADPFDLGTPDEDDLCVLDPAVLSGWKPKARKLSEAYAYLRKYETAMDREWKKKPGIQDLQIAGVWVFARRSDSIKGALCDLLAGLSRDACERSRDWPA
jgi:hypothetical protein